MSDKKRAFLARYGTEHHLVDLLKNPDDDATVTALHGAMQNPHFKGGHITMLLNSIEGTGSQCDPIRYAIANHPLTSKQNLERLVEPHRGWPFRGTDRHRWPAYANVAAQRIRNKELDEDD